MGWLFSFLFQSIEIDSSIIPLQFYRTKEGELDGTGKGEKTVGLESKLKFIFSLSSVMIRTDLNGIKGCRIWEGFGAKMVGAFEPSSLYIPWNNNYLFYYLYFMRFVLQSNKFFLLKNMNLFKILYKFKLSKYNFIFIKRDTKT